MSDILHHPHYGKLHVMNFLEYLLVIKLNNYSEQDNAFLYWSHLGSWMKGLEVTTIHTWGKIIQQQPLCSVILSTPVTRRECHSRRVSTIWLFQMNSFENKFPNKLHCDFRGKNNYAVTKQMTPKETTLTVGTWGFAFPITSVCILRFSTKAKAWIGHTYSMTLLDSLNCMSRHRR